MTGTPAASIQTTGGAVTLEGNSDDAGGGAINYSGTINHGSGGTTVIANDDSTINGIVIGAAGFTKNGDGSLTLSGGNLFDGETTIASGVVRASNVAALGTPLGGTTVATGAALLIDGVSIADNVTISGAGVNVSGINAALAGAGTASLDGNLILANDAQINAAFRSGSTIFTINGAISETGGSRSLTVRSSVGGGESIVLTNPLNSWTGTTNVVNNTLILGNDEVIPDVSDVTVNSTLRLHGQSETINALSGNGTITDLVGGNSTLIVGSNNGGADFTGSVQDGTGTVNLTKTGTGSQTLLGLNSATGVLAVNGGMLAVDGTWGGTATVAAGATLGGTGSVDGSVNAEGTIAPGNSPGVLSTGDVNFADGSAFDVEVEGVIPGASIGGYDQLNVTGSVTIGNSVTLTTILGVSFEPFDGDEFVIINNDGGDAVTGTFAGFNEGTTFDVDGQTLTITYVGGDGNDVVLLGQGTASTLITLDASNNLLIRDINGGTSNDTLTIISDVANGRFVITDPGRALTTDVAGAVRVDSRTVQVPFASVAGSNVNFDLLGGDDSLTIDLSAGNFAKTINVFGGSDIEVGDDLLIQGGGTFASTTITATGIGQGTIDISGNGPINYFDVEPVRSIIDSTDVTLNNGTGGGGFAIADSGFAGETQASAPLGAPIFFRNPTSQLTLNGDLLGDDILDINGFGSGFAADLIIDGRGGNDVANWNTIQTPASLNATGEIINLNSGSVSTLASQTFNGSVRLTTDTVLNGTDITFTGSIGDASLPLPSTLTINASGDTNLNADIGVPAPLGLVTVNSMGGAANFAGLLNNFGTAGLAVAGARDVTFSGSNTASSLGGIDIEASRSIALLPGSSLVVQDGSISLQANQQQTPSEGSSIGVTIESSSVMTRDGNVNISGRGGNMADGNQGVVIRSGAIVSSNGAGAVNITGTGGPGDNSNTGVVIESGSLITVSSGNVTLTSNGGGTGDDNDGIIIRSGGQVTSTGLLPETGNITINGTSGNGVNNNQGIVIAGSGSQISVTSGTITLNGSGNGSGNDNDGVIVQTGGQVISTGVDTGNITIDGTGGNGTNNNQGVIVDGAGSNIAITSGSVTP